VRCVLLVKDSQKQQCSLSFVSFNSAKGSTFIEFRDITLVAMTSWVFCSLSLSFSQPQRSGRVGSEGVGVREYDASPSTRDGFFDLLCRLPSLSTVEKKESRGKQVMPKREALRAWLQRLASPSASSLPTFISGNHP
jgi:hypothetical protein